MRRVLAGIWLGLSLCAASQLAAQDTSASRRQLDSIRRERDKLEAQQRKFQGQVTDVEAQLRNIARQADATNRVVNAIEAQISGLGSQLERSAAELALAQDNLAERKAVLNRRLTDIYKRGPLHTYQVLLAAESFGELLARYKYLYLTSRQDRSLLEDVTRLTARVSGQRDQVLGIKTELDRKRLDREAELEHFAELADESANRTRQIQTSLKGATAKITALDRDAAALNAVLARVERDSKANAAKPGAAPVPAAGRMSTADMRSLDWPVDGDIIYTFGPETLPTGGVVPNNGIGIAAAVGTPVKVVGIGTVAGVATYGSWGLTVIVQHGDYFSLYMQLQKSLVTVGQRVDKGAVIGTVGGANSGRGPHLHFEIRGKSQIALDPLSWLKGKR